MPPLAHGAARGAATPEPAPRTVQPPRGRPTARAPAPNYRERLHLTFEQFESQARWHDAVNERAVSNGAVGEAWGRVKKTFGSSPQTCFGTLCEVEKYRVPKHVCDSAVETCTKHAFFTVEHCRVRQAARRVGGGGSNPEPHAGFFQTSLNFVVKMLLQPPEMKFNKEKKR